MSVGATGPQVRPGFADRARVTPVAVTSLLIKPAATGPLLVVAAKNEAI